MENCVSVRRKDVMSGRIIWKGSLMSKMIGSIMWTWVSSYIASQNLKLKIFSICQDAIPFYTGII